MYQRTSHSPGGTYRWPRDGLQEGGIPMANVGKKDGPTYMKVEQRNDDHVEPSDTETYRVSMLTDRESEGDRNNASTKANPERPKIALSRNRARAFLHVLLFYVIPLAGAIALVIINIKTRFVGVNGTWISGLQFVAKVHEILMAGSIITIMLVYLQHLLTQASAVPFGTIFSAYQVTQMSYLWSSEFLGVLTASHFRRFSKLIFVLFVPFNILLAAAVGPSSAIAMLPRLANFTVPDFQLVLNTTIHDLFPDTLADSGPPLNISDIRQNELSPAAGWRYLRQLPSVDSSPNTESGLQGEGVNLGHNSKKTIWVMPALSTVDFESYRTRDLLSTAIQDVTRRMYLQYAPNSTFATIQHVPIALALKTAGWDFTGYLSQDSPGSDIASINMPQAYASVACNFNTILDENDIRPIQFPDTYVAGCNNQCDNQWSLNYWNFTNHTAISMKEIWNQAKNRSEGRVIWVDSIEVSSPVAGTTLGAIVIQPEFCNNTSAKPFLTTSACTIGGVWANTTSTLEVHSNGLDVTFGIAQSIINPTTFGVLPQWTQPPIHLSKTWAESLNAPTDVQNRTVVDNLLRWMPVTSNLCPFNGSYPQDTDQIHFLDSRPFMHEALIAGLVANGMSHAARAVEEWRALSPGWGHRSSTGQQEQQTDPPGIVLTFQGYLPGYAYTLHGLPIKLALPILTMYCVYTLAYICYTIVTGRSSMTWGSISKLTALAINSSPTRVLENTGAGIDRTETFRKLVTVREVEAHDRLELVFQQDEKEKGPYRRVVVNRAYA